MNSRYFACVLGLAIAGCAPDDLRWEYQISGVDDVRGLVARVREGGCSGPVVFESEFARGGTPNQPSELDHDMRYGFEIEGRNAQCEVIAIGCEELSLPTPDEAVRVMVGPTSGGAACSPAMCNTGTCGGGGVIPDGGVDAAEDAGSEDASPDSGGVRECPGDTCTDEGCRPASPVSELALGNAHTCVIVDDELLCFGTSDRGAVGNGSDAPVTTPTRVNDQPFTRVAAAANNTCALGLSAGTPALYCFGANEFGQVGNGRQGVDAFEPQLTLSGVQDFDVGGTHVCAVATARELYCWGNNANGQSNFGSATSFAEPRRFATGSIGGVELGGRHTCALLAGTVQCWGDNTEGQITGPQTSRSEFRSVSVNFLFAGEAGTCGAGGGALACWGRNTGDAIGSLGLPEGTYTSPTRVASVMPNAGAMWRHSCIIVGGEMSCAGPGGEGQLGDGMRQNRNMLTPVAGDQVWQDVEVGGSHTCAIDSLGALWCWGRGVEGQLGLGGVTSASVPSRVCIP